MAQKYLCNARMATCFWKLVKNRLTMGLAPVFCCLRTDSCLQGTGEECQTAAGNVVSWKPRILLRRNYRGEKAEKRSGWVGSEMLA